ncbi:MAG: NUDIX domain-containing protein [Candidatus Saccharibacteria bacterium]
MKPDLLDSFEYHGEHIDVEWFDVLSKDKIPNLPWQQVYAVGDLSGKVPIVMYENDNDNLPGGKTEPGETPDQTIKREIQEEINCSVISWEPLGYQCCSVKGGDKVYQLRVFAKLEKNGEFESDPGGSVIGYHTINIDDLNKIIRWGLVGDRVQKLACIHYKRL